MGVVTVERKGDIAWATVHNPPVNATSTAVRAGLAEAVQAVQGARLAVLCCANGAFIAGGDMSEFDHPPQEPHLPDVVDAIEASETPFLALMGGHVLGGGLEIAMACAWRAARPGTRFGLPEVNVGLIPGAGGTQRAPRLLGWDAAIDLACSGRMLTAEDMLTLGGIDAIADDLQAAAEQWCAPRPVPVSQRLVAPVTADDFELRRAALVKRAKGQDSPLLNLQALQWATLPFAEGRAKERALHLELRQSDESRALRHAFFSERAAAKPAAISGAHPQSIETVVIVGGGLMGAGIAAAMLTAGLRVAIIERSADAAQAAHSRVAGLISGALKRGKIDQRRHDAQLEALSVHADDSPAADADLILEAVFEDLTAKQAVFARVASIARPDAILATNTSYLDPQEIFADISHPERCIGLHFFAPAHIMKLLEVVRPPAASAQSIASAFALAKRLRKVAVLSGVCDGFIGNRMLAAYRRAAEYMLADGATPHEIDSAMRAFGMAMGPFAAQDMSGLQIAEANRRRQDAARDPAERYVGISDRLCALGRYGQRVGKGWHLYADGDRAPRPDPDVEALIAAYSTEKGLTRRSFKSEDIQIRLLAVLANEGARIVDEGLAETDGAVDMVQIHGYGFPRWRGGPMQAARALGDSAICAALDALEADSPGSWRRAQRWTAL